MSFKLPNQGFLFWPVGNGDSSTIVANSDHVIQIDLYQMECSAEEDDPHAQVVEELVALLPKKDKKPYLSLFVLTHPDQDHCQGFSELLKQVSIGEIWFTPRVFREFSGDLCDDAKSFKKEINRRVKKTIEAKGDPGTGERVRIIGYDELLQEDDYKGFPKALLTVPGTSITQLDGDDLSTCFRAFIHAPFKDDAAGDRNECSLGMQVKLSNDSVSLHGLFLGDLSYPTLKKISDRSDAEDLNWNVLLAPHHCSKSAMYWQEEEDGEESLKQDILDSLEAAALSPGYIISSSEPIPSKNKEGDNPPHAIAKERYEEIAPDDFVCTQESSGDDAIPVVVTLTDQAITISRGEKVEDDKSLSAAVAKGRGTQSPPTQRVGFGHSV